MQKALWPREQETGWLLAHCLEVSCVWHILHSLSGEGASTAYPEDDLSCG